MQQYFGYSNKTVSSKKYLKKPKNRYFPIGGRLSVN